jgi:phage shock protein E
MMYKNFSNNRSIVLVLFSFAVAIFFAANFSRAEQSANIPELVQDNAVVWVDTRSWFENKIDNIEGDPRISYSDIADGVKELGLQKDTPIRLYCAAGVRAGKAVKILQAQGYSDVENAGGIDDVRTIRFPEPTPAAN